MLKQAPGKQSKHGQTEPERVPLSLSKNIFLATVYQYLKHLLIHRCHHIDVIMGTLASQITSFTIVFSTVYSDADQRKHQIFRVLGLCAGNSPVAGEFHAHMAIDAEYVSIWWRHHEYPIKSAQMSSSESCARIDWHARPRIRNINRMWPKTNQPKMWSTYVTNPKCKPFLPCILK